MKRLIVLSLLVPLPAAAQEVAFEWPSIVECAHQPVPHPVQPLPQVGQPTSTLVANYVDAQKWSTEAQNIQFCKVAVSAWMAGWRAGHAGKPEDPAP